MRRWLALGTVLIAGMVPAVVAYAGAAGNDKGDLFITNAADCDGTGATGPVGGFANARVNVTQGVVRGNVHIKNGLPNAHYDVFIRCIRQIGVLDTNSKGVGNLTFETDAAGVPPVFVFDMHAMPGFQQTMISEQLTPFP